MFTKLDWNNHLVILALINPILSDNHMDMNELHTQSEVIDALGGNEAVAGICTTSRRIVTGKVVSGWRKNGFPARTYLVLQAALLKSGCRAPDELWNMIPLSSHKESA